MYSRSFTARRLGRNAAADTDEWVVEEGPLQIRVNGNPFTVTMRTPGDDARLILGLLFSEGLVEKPADIVSLSEEPSRNGAASWSVALASAVVAATDKPYRSLASTSSCGLCGKTEWETHQMSEETIGRRSLHGAIRHERLSSCFRAMGERQAVFGRTGGSHAAAVFSESGALLAFGEDVGRHNAVDKVVGGLWQGGRLREGHLLCVSGRVSYEIAAKTRRAGFPVLAAVSAPSSLAVEYCREAGITLIGFCREDRATVYTHPERVVSAGDGAAEGVVPTPASVHS